MTVAPNIAWSRPRLSALVESRLFGTAGKLLQSGGCAKSARRLTHTVSLHKPGIYEDESIDVDKYLIWNCFHILRIIKNEIMNIHSKILVHWTGKKDIENRPKNIQAQLYVERLKDYYQNGLFLKRTEEAVLRGLKIKYLLRLCFTEIRLSQAQEHANRYGKLGIGFTRDFIMNNGGRPVIYIPYEADKCLLEDSLKKAYEKSEGIEEIHRPLKWVLAYIKRMSNGDGEEHYDEMEWRIVHDENPNDEHFTKGKEEGIYRFKFAASDIKVIIFPDDETKQISFNDKSIKEFFSQHMPIAVTLDDCDNF